MRQCCRGRGCGDCVVQIPVRFSTYRPLVCPSAPPALSNTGVPGTVSAQTTNFGRNNDHTGYMYRLCQEHRPHTLQTRNTDHTDYRLCQEQWPYRLHVQTLSGTLTTQTTDFGRNPDHTDYRLCQNGDHTDYRLYQEHWPHRLQTRNNDHTDYRLGTLTTQTTDFGRNTDQNRLQTLSERWPHRLQTLSGTLTTQTTD